MYGATSHDYLCSNWFVIIGHSSNWFVVIGHTSIRKVPTPSTIDKCIYFPFRFGLGFRFSTQSRFLIMIAIITDQNKNLELFGFRDFCGFHFYYNKYSMFSKYV